MIPKKIHFCWFGCKPLPEDVQNYIESWQRHCPDYEIIRWDETNYDVHKNDYVKAAYENKKWAFLTDYARLDIVYHEGGIYLDTDVELIKNLDNLLDQECFMGMEQVGTVATGLGFGAEKGHPFLKINMQAYEERQHVTADGAFRPETCVKITTRLLRKQGLQAANRIQTIAGVTVYPTDYFCPLTMGTSKMTVTENTYSIHHYAASWYSGSPWIKKLKLRLIPLKIFVKKHILRREE